MPSYIRGGDKLERRLDDIARKLKDGAVLRVGFLAGATYPNGTPVAMVAAIQNFGAPSVGIPPRPFFSNMVRDHAAEWPATIEGLLKANDYDVQKTMDLVGTAIAGQLRQAIVDTNAPQLSEVTLLLRQWKSKGRMISKRVVWEAIRAVQSGVTSGLKGTAAKPLVETGVMLGAVDYEVEVK